MGLGANTHVGKSTKNGDTLFWGEKINSKNGGFCNHLVKKRLNVDQKRGKKVKPGVVSAVLTSQNANEVVVSKNF